jgi:hypothetical protein
MARVVAAGVPHHAVQRGNRRQRVFLCESDYKDYLKLVAEFCEREHTRTGRPLGGIRFIARLEQKLGRRLAPLKRGPKSRGSRGHRH